MSKKGRRLKQHTQSRCVHCGEAKRIFHCSMRRVVLSPTLASLLCVQMFQGILFTPSYWKDLAVYTCCHFSTADPVFAEHTVTHSLICTPTAHVKNRVFQLSHLAYIENNYWWTCKSLRHCVKQFPVTPYHHSALKYICIFCIMHLNG